MIGVTLALLVKRGAWMPPRVRFVLPLAILGYALSEAPTLPGTDVHPGLAVTVGAFALLVASLASADAHRSSTFLARPLWQELGRVSFAFYLVHLLVIASVSSAWPTDTRSSRGVGPYCSRSPRSASPSPSPS